MASTGRLTSNPSTHRPQQSRRAGGARRGEEGRGIETGSPPDSARRCRRRTARAGDRGVPPETSWWKPGAACLPSRPSWSVADAGAQGSAPDFAAPQIDDRARATAQVLAEHPDIDGLFVASDLMAVGALAALADAGRLVPGHVAVVGYDNLGAATTTSPTLTTVVNPVVAMARTAGEMLIDLLAGKSVDPAPVIFAPELVIRLSA